MRVTGPSVNIWEVVWRHSIITFLVHLPNNRIMYVSTRDIRMDISPSARIERALTSDEVNPTWGTSMVIVVCMAVVISDLPVVD